MSLTGNVTDAEEVVQEAVSRTVRARPKFGSERDAHNYVLTAVRTAALQLFQQRRRLSPLDELAPSKANEEISSDPLRMMLGEERTRNRRHLVELALRLVGDLEPVHREVLELLVLGDPPLKLREVAAIQGAPISTVHSRLQAALLQVGRRMEAESASGGGLEK
ncbi:MAG TPA: RNA polymerase sigma factor [Acidobacteriota bacterium]|nr:RNA polymerase sigma factor [Acidobacteriota bacterium]